MSRAELVIVQEDTSEVQRFIETRPGAIVNIRMDGGDDDMEGVIALLEAFYDVATEGTTIRRDGGKFRYLTLQLRGGRVEVGNG